LAATNERKAEKRRRISSRQGRYQFQQEIPTEKKAVKKPIKVTETLKGLSFHNTQDMIAISEKFNSVWSTHQDEDEKNLAKLLPSYWTVVTVKNTTKSNGKSKSNNGDKSDKPERQLEPEFRQELVQVQQLNKYNVSQATKILGHDKILAANLAKWERVKQLVDTFVTEKSNTSNKDSSSFQYTNVLDIRGIGIMDLTGLSGYSKTGNELFGKVLELKSPVKGISLKPSKIYMNADSDFYRGIVRAVMAENQKQIYDTSATEMSLTVDKIDDKKGKN